MKSGDKAADLREAVGIFFDSEDLHRAVEPGQDTSGI